MKVRLLASTTVTPEMYQWMEEIDWSTDAENSGDLLAEVCGRLCYRSWKAGDNKNVTKVREGNRPYLANILDSGHGSVLEHVSATFLLEGVSRVLTHELVRHRAGCAYSQESLRYVRAEDFELVLPDEPLMDEIDHEFMQETAEYIRRKAGLVLSGAKMDDRPFSQKKAITSWVRRILPMGLKTNIIFTANVRALRHMIVMRTSPGAELEIREAFAQIAELCDQAWPNLFQDLRSQNPGNGPWVYHFSNNKV